MQMLMLPLPGALGYCKPEGAAPTASQTSLDLLIVQIPTTPAEEESATWVTPCPTAEQLDKHKSYPTMLLVPTMASNGHNDNGRYKGRNGHKAAPGKVHGQIHGAAPGKVHGHVGSRVRSWPR